MNDNKHLPVLLAEVIKNLVTSKNGAYIDGTYGRGGHSQAILSDLSDEGKLIVIDKDLQAYEDAKQKLGHDSRVIIRQGSFRMLGTLTQELNLTGKIQGILLDLGI